MKLKGYRMRTGLGLAGLKWAGQRPCARVSFAAYSFPNTPSLKTAMLDGQVTLDISVSAEQMFTDICLSRHS
jgi:hypothetical protein